MVQPVPAPDSTRADPSSKNKDGGRSQKLMLLRRGNAISGLAIKIGTNQLPYPPTSAGIVIKKIINSACAVIRTLYS